MDDLEVFNRIQSLEKTYTDKPWPEISSVAFLTDVCGGLGDIITSEKAISIIQKELPHITIDWIITKDFSYIEQSKNDAHKVCSNFLEQTKFVSKNVQMYRFGTNINKTYDLMIIAPVRVGWSVGYIERKCNIKVNQTFTFYEAAHRMSYYYDIIANVLDKLKNPIRDNNNIYGLSMGLIPGTGMFIDNKRISLHGSKNVTHLISDDKLRTMIEIYHNYSINFGYAHHDESHIKFMQCVCIHEKYNNIILLLNANGEYLKKKEFNAKQLCSKIKANSVIDEFVIPDLTKYGIGNIIKDGSLIKMGYGRELIIITYEKLTRDDIMYLQIISDRLLATGDNTSIESICCFPKLYLYEDVHNGGCKNYFLQQQVNLCNNKFGRLLHLFGSHYDFFDDEDIKEIEDILCNDLISDYVHKFCTDVVNNYSFKDVMLASMKRVLYHYYNPELWKDELIDNVK